MTEYDNFWQELSDRQIAAVVYKIDNPDATYKQIAEDLDIPEGTLARWRLNEIVKQVLQQRANLALDLIDHYNLRAIRVLAQQLDSNDEKVAQTAAKALLEWSIGKPLQRNELTGKDGSALTIGIVGMDLKDL